MTEDKGHLRAKLAAVVHNDRRWKQSKYGVR